MSDETRFGLEFVVTRNGEPITRVISVQALPITLHGQHDMRIVWAFQIKALTELLRNRLREVDGLAGVVPDARPIGLEPQRHLPAIEAVGVPILKRVNAVLGWLLRRRSKQSISVRSDGLVLFPERLTSEEVEALKRQLEREAKRRPNGGA